MSAEFVAVLITINEDHFSSIKPIVTELKNAGMDVLEVLTKVGIVTGKVAPERVAELRKVAGVADVELDGEMQEDIADALS